MGCNHSGFDGGCSWCLLQYDQTEAAKWAAEDAAKMRSEAKDHHRRMEKAAQRAASTPRQAPPTAPLPPKDLFSGPNMVVLLIIGGVVLLASAATVLISTVIAVIAQLVQVALAVGIVGGVAYLVVKNRRSSSGT